MAGRRRSGAIWKAAAATVAYGLLHSALASTRAKRAAARHLGERNRAGLYRTFYNAQAVLTFAGLLLYLRSLPREEVYRIEGGAGLVMRAGQASGLLWAVLAAREVGIGPITGLSSLAEWLRGGSPAPEPEAQGPAPAEGGGLRVKGPFRLSRHPLNLAPLPVLWLQPIMTTRWLGVAAASTVYLVTGSLHEERRLEAAYGEPYRRYLRSGTPFYVPAPRRGALRSER